METQFDLKQILKHEMLWYAQIQGYKVRNHFLLNEDLSEYSIVVVSDADYPLERFTRVMMMAHIDGEYIVVDADNTDKPLYEGLMHAGIPREKIILAY
nr:XisI protein [Anaerolineae bacterium]